MLMYATQSIEQSSIKLTSHKKKRLRFLRLSRFELTSSNKDEAGIKFTMD
jgi:hypothetical protein